MYKAVALDMNTQALRIFRSFSMTQILSSTTENKSLGYATQSVENGIR